MAWLAQRCISLFSDELIKDQREIHGVHSMIDDDQWESGGGIIHRRQAHDRCGNAPRPALLGTGTPGEISASH